MEQQKVLVEKVRFGLFFKDACILAGVPIPTFERWMQRGEASDPEDPDEPYHSFAQAVRRAEAEAIEAATLALQAHWEKDWRAAEKFLARKRPKEWGEPKGDAPASTGATVVFVMPPNGRDDPSSLPQVSPATAIDVRAREVE